MTSYHCDFCGEQSPSVNILRDWLSSTGVKEVCDPCYKNIEKVHHKAQKTFNEARDKAFKDWIIENKKRKLQNQ